MLTGRRGLECVFVALDTADVEEFERWCRFFGPRVGGLKVGLEAYTRWGPVAVETARGEARRVFVDLKLHDIPTTVAGAVRAAVGLGADLVSVHTAGGSRMMEAAVEAAGPDAGVLGVTVLTHLDSDDLGELGVESAPSALVATRAGLAHEAGCAGVVCSPLELEELRRVHPPPFVLVTPGIRPRGAQSDDQRRVAAPAEAVEAGADLLVIGRPLTRVSDPARALDEVRAELEGAEPAGGSGSVDRSEGSAQKW